MARFYRTRLAGARVARLEYPFRPVGTSVSIHDLMIRFDRPPSWAMARRPGLRIPARWEARQRSIIHYGPLRASPLHDSNGYRHWLYHVHLQDDREHTLDASRVLTVQCSSHIM
jgi:hypothetical protein